MSNKLVTAASKVPEEGHVRASVKENPGSWFQYRVPDQQSTEAETIDSSTPADLPDRQASVKVGRRISANRCMMIAKLVRSDSTVAVIMGVRTSISKCRSPGGALIRALAEVLSEP
jgi:hypothetical protein